MPPVMNKRTHRHLCIQTQPPSHTRTLNHTLTHTHICTVASTVHTLFTGTQTDTHTHKDYDGCHGCKTIPHRKGDITPLLQPLNLSPLSLSSLLSLLSISVSSLLFPYLSSLHPSPLYIPLLSPSLSSLPSPSLPPGVQHMSGWTPGS